MPAPHRGSLSVPPGPGTQDVRTEELPRRSRPPSAPRNACPLQARQRSARPPRNEPPRTPASSCNFHPNEPAQRGRKPLRSGCQPSTTRCPKRRWETSPSGSERRGLLARRADQLDLPAREDPRAAGHVLLAVRTLPIRGQVREIAAQLHRAAGVRLLQGGDCLPRGLTRLLGQRGGVSPPARAPNAAAAAARPAPRPVPPRGSPLAASAHPRAARLAAEPRGPGIRAPSKTCPSSPPHHAPVWEERPEAP